MLKRIYLDTNTLFDGWPARPGGQLRDLFALAEHLSVEIVICDSVLVELKNSTVWHILEHLRDADADVVKANSWARKAGIHFDAPVCDVPAVERYLHEQLDRAIKRDRLTVAATTRVPIEEFVRRAAFREAPFKDEDRGFRDAVHLQSAQDDLVLRPMSPGERAVFVTKDQKLTDTLSSARRRDLEVSRLPPVLQQLETVLPKDELARSVVLNREAAALFREESQQLSDAVKRLLTWNILPPGIQDRGTKGAELLQVVRASVQHSDDVRSFHSATADIDFRCSAIAEGREPEALSRYPPSFYHFDLSTQIEAVVEIDRGHAVRLVNILSVIGQRIRWLDDRLRDLTQLAIDPPLVLDLER